MAPKAAMQTRNKNAQWPGLTRIGSVSAPEDFYLDPRKHSLDPGISDNDSRIWLKSPRSNLAHRITDCFPISGSVIRGITGWDPRIYRLVKRSGEKPARETKVPLTTTPLLDPRKRKYGSGILSERS